VTGYSETIGPAGRFSSSGGVRAEGAHRLGRGGGAGGAQGPGAEVIVDLVGSAHTDAELGVLLDQACQIVTGEQEALSIAVPVRPARVADMPDWRTSTLLPVPLAP
jgi:hypothetical protein